MASAVRALPLTHSGHLQQLTEVTAASSSFCLSSPRVFPAAGSLSLCREQWSEKECCVLRSSDCMDTVPCGGPACPELHMCVHTCECIVNMCTHVCVHAYEWVYWIRVSVYMCMCRSMYLCVCTWIRACTCAYTHVSLQCVCMHGCEHTCVMCMCVYICVYRGAYYVCMCIVYLCMLCTLVLQVYMCANACIHMCAYRLVCMYVHVYMNMYL